MIDFNFENINEPQSGSVLISEPFLSDSYFSRAVILICNHNENGTFGFVLNKYVDTKLTTMLEGFPPVDVRLSIGGPVDTSNLFFIHTLGDKIPHAQKMSNGMFIGGDFNAVKLLLENEPATADQFRFFIGYSGWKPEQLSDELSEKSWVVLNDIPNSVILNTSNDQLWTDLMVNLGGKFKLMSTFPKNPSDN